MSLTVISLFSGAMGLDLGFEKAGFDIRIASDIRPEVCKTISLNRPGLPVLEGDITDIPTSEILEKARLSQGEATLLIGGPPCQPFSTAGARKSFNEKRGQVLFEYIRLINEAKPRFFVFENVKGLTNAALKHMPFYERIKKERGEIDKESQLGSAFKYVLELLADTGYTIKYKILNAADFGTPQKRQRVIIIGSRNGENVDFPQPIHGAPGSLPVLSGSLKPWASLREALDGMLEEEQEYTKLPVWGKYLEYVKPGGCWRDIPLHLQQEAMKGAYFSQGGRTGFFRRLGWDGPSPTLVTFPVFKGSCLAHPDRNRALSVQEYARIQGFPDDWKFYGSLQQRYRMIGEAVPVQLSYAIASVLKKHAFKVLELEQCKRGRDSKKGLGLV